MITIQDGLMAYNQHLEEKNNLCIEEIKAWSGKCDTLTEALALERGKSAKYEGIVFKLFHYLNARGDKETVGFIKQALKDTNDG